MSEEKKYPISFIFGIMEKPLGVQAKEQGFYLANASFYQKIMRQIAGLGISGILTETERNKAYDRLLKKIVESSFKIVPDNDFTWEMAAKNEIVKENGLCQCVSCRTFIKENSGLLCADGSFTCNLDSCREEVNGGYFIPVMK